jgi:uncharacterized phage protein (TIGR01671 family)
MKREIKFRAWVVSSEGAGILKNPYMMNDTRTIFGWLYEGGVGMELMQFTGLKDKNGKEIYEGDIVRAVLFYPESIFDGDKVTLVEETNRVIFDKGCWCIDGEDDYDGGVLCRYDELYVLGNVFETPSLLTNQVK